jgi:NAD(P)-dependent dehydrogenase (short-subunit alcohol dehydrogenase family)
VISLGQLEVAPVEDFDWQYRINGRAPYALTQALLPMLRARRGQIVFINSSVGLGARANVGQYAATKHALKAIADSLRGEENADGLRVLSVFLGRTATPMQQAVHEMEGRAYHPKRLMRPEDVATVEINALSLPRSAEVTDISIRPLAKPYY